MTQSRLATGTVRLDQMNHSPKRRLLEYRVLWLNTHPPFHKLKLNIYPNRHAGHIWQDTPKNQVDAGHFHYFSTLDQAHEILDVIEIFCE